jgi:hypothetical protein
MERNTFDIDNHTVHCAKTGARMPIRKCAVCREESAQDSFSVTGSGGPPDLDTRPAGEIRATLERWIEICPGCGLAVPEIEAPVEGVEELVRSPEFPRREHPFRRQAWLLDQLGQHADAGWSELYLAWHFDDSSDAESSAAARREAITCWQHGKSHGQDFCDSMAEEFALVTDVCRRAGLFDEAKETCLAGLELDELPQIVEDILRYQLTLIQGKDTGAHSVAELPSAPEGGVRVALD